VAQRINRKIVLVKRPEGEVTPDCMRLSEGPAPEPADGEALIKNLYLSLDPTQQGWMKYDTYMPAIPIGEVIRSGGVGEVIESRSPHYALGQLVSGLVGWQEYAIADGGGNRMQGIPDGVSPVDAVSIFGITGLTAYFGLLDVGRPKAGETVVVSGAAGATGSVVGQIAKIHGCRVVGIAGTPEKCRWLTEAMEIASCCLIRTWNCLPCQSRSSLPLSLSFWSTLLVDLRCSLSTCHFWLCRLCISLMPAAMDSRKDKSMATMTESSRLFNPLV
jgi:NADPH-dependent curcumin reductase CurA